MKNLLKVLLGFFVVIVYIPLSMISSYTVMSTLTNVFNSGYTSSILNIIFGIIGVITLFIFVVLLDKIISKIIIKKIRFMTLCTMIPIIIFCVAMVVINLNFINLQKQVNSANLNLVGESSAISAALISLSSMFVVLSFLYLAIFVLYVLVWKVKDLIKSKKIKIKK